MSDALSSELIALAQVVFIDLVLAGDNAVVVGLAAAGVAASQRRKVIFWGIAAAVVLRVVFASVTTQLMTVVGLLLAGGLLLLWVSWKLWREIRILHAQEAFAMAGGRPGNRLPEAPTKTPRQAILQVAVADVSMSLDNVLAVAGAARDHVTVLVIGLVLSVALMGLAATLIARILERHRWVAYIGLFIIVYVALRMIWDGSFEVAAAVL